MREQEDAKRLARLPIAERPILTYVEDDYSWNQLGPYLDQLMTEHGRPVTYVTSDPDDPKFDDQTTLLSVFYIKETLPSFLPEVDSPVFFTTMPDLDSMHVRRPQSATCVYGFHSLNSTTMAYRPHAFDAYDVFFCTGPHHKEELAQTFDRLGKEVDLREVGYPKLDRIAERQKSYVKRHPDQTTILSAPSWGPDNALAAGGGDLVAGLVEAGYRVVVRPHPAFFESLYPEGAQLVAQLQDRFAANEAVTIEASIVSEDSFMEADLMVSDWSGAAFEYALGTARPVLFLDLPRKVNNPDWQQWDLVPFEDRMRHEVGAVVPPHDPAAAVDAVTELLAGAQGSPDRLARIRNESVYNFGRAATVGAAILDELAPAD